MSILLVGEDIIVFDADQADFQISDATAALKQGKLVVLFGTAMLPESLSRVLLKGMSRAELRRYEAYKSKISATQFLCGRILLRDLLVSYYECAADQIEVSCQENVKPVAECRASVLPTPQFNLSHSGAWVVLGAHRDTPVGIDIECVDQLEINTLCAMDDLFTQNEREYLARSIDRNTKAELFYQIWRCKEAVMKATGLGFGLAPNSFEVLNQEGEFESIVHVEHTDWHLKQMNLRDGLACAVAVGIPPLVGGKATSTT